MAKIILHLCADTGSDSYFYRKAGYDVRLIGSGIGVENYTAPDNVYGVFANPVCTELSTARTNGTARDPVKGLFLVQECLRVIAEAKPHFWVLENPSTGALKNYLGKPAYSYQPWWYGSPWTKGTALWGQFNIPPRRYYDWGAVPKLDALYTRPGRGKPSLAFCHKSAFYDIPEFQHLPVPTSDMEFRSLCSQKFAEAFYNVNR